jgi:ubiquinol-cytochrome c reductase cytochrome b subunit
VFVPAVVLPGLLFTLLGAYPFIEQWVVGDRREHQLLDRPRNVPVRTGLGVMAISFYVILLAAGANDILAITFHLSINAITDTFRVLILTVPPLTFEVTKRICLGLQLRDRETIAHGRETGVLVRLPNGGVVELLEPVPEPERQLLGSYECPRAIDVGPNSLSGWRAAAKQLQARLSQVYSEECLAPPTPEELRGLEHAAVDDGAGSGIPGLFSRRLPGGTREVARSRDARHLLSGESDGDRRDRKP